MARTKKEKKIGRPKLANKNILRSAKIELAMAFLLAGIMVLSGTSVLTGKSPIELLSFGAASKVSGNYIINPDNSNESVTSYQLNLNSTNGDIKLFVPDAERFFSLRIYYKKTDSSTSWTLAEEYNYYGSDEAIFDAFWHINKLKFIFRKLADYGPSTANKYRIQIRTLTQNGLINNTLTKKNCKTGWNYNGWCYKDVTIKKEKILSKIRESVIVEDSDKTFGSIDLIISPTNNTKYMTVRKYMFNLRRNSWIEIVDKYASSTESLSFATIMGSPYYKGIDVWFYATKTTKYRIFLRLESTKGVIDKNKTKAACPTGWGISSGGWCYKTYNIGPK